MKRLTPSVALAATLLALPAGAADLLSGSSWALLSPRGAADLKTVPGSGGPVLHVTVRHAAVPYYQIQLTHDIAAVVPAGTTLHYQFWARSANGDPIHATIEKRTTPYTHYADKYLQLTPAWKLYTLAAKIPVASSPRGLAARLQVGQKAGSVEFKAISLTR